MIRLIIGQNASGKTLYLNKLVQDRVKNSNNIDFVTNLDKSITFRNMNYVAERLEALEEITMSDFIDINSEIISAVNSACGLSRQFLYIMTILCKDVKIAYLDEPEQGLSEYEQTLLCRFINICNESYDEIIIVTHSELLFSIEYDSLDRVEMSRDTDALKLISVPEDKKYEVID